MHIDAHFTYQPPTETQPQRYVTLRKEALQFAKLIQALTPVSDEQQIALERLRETVMWANAAIAMEGKV